MTAPRYSHEHQTTDVSRDVLYDTPFNDATTLDEEKAGNGLHRLTRPTGNRPDPGPDMEKDE